MNDAMSYALLDTFAWQESVNRCGLWTECDRPHMITDEKSVQAGLERAAQAYGYWLH